MKLVCPLTMGLPSEISISGEYVNADYLSRRRRRSNLTVGVDKRGRPKKSEDGRVFSAGADEKAVLSAIYGVRQNVVRLATNIH